MATEWSDTLRARRWWIAAVVGLAVLVALLLALLRSPTFTATATAVAAAARSTGPVPETTPPETTPPETTPPEVARTVVDLAGTAPVHDAAARDAGVDVEQAAAVEVSASEAGIVTVIARGDSPDRAARLATATTAALADALARLDAAGLRAALAPLEGRLQELTATLVSTPLGDPARTPLEQRYASLAGVVAERTAAPSPRLLPDGEPEVTAVRSPLAEALLAAVAALVLAGVAVLVARGMDGERGRRARRDRTLALARVDGPHAVVHPGDDVPAVLTRLYDEVVRGRGPVLLLQLADPAARDVARDLVEAARIAGDVLPLRDLTPDARRWSPDDRDEPAVYALRRRRVDGDALDRVRDVGVRAALVAVDTRRAVPARLADTVSALESAAVQVRGVVVWRGRFPRDRAVPAADVDAPAAVP